jgi:hypothetical protein
MEKEWDSGSLVLEVLAAVAVAGGLLVLVPQVVRRTALSLFFVYHFFGIVLAANTMPVVGQPAPWLNSQLSTHLYLKYLNFLYLTNAYHFYSPDPGPPQLLWFHIEYSDGTSEWKKIPAREDFRTRLEFQRRLSVSESTNDLSGIVPGPVYLTAAVSRRNYAASYPERQGVLLSDLEMLPFIQGGGSFVRKPSAYSQRMVSSCARFVAANYARKDDPNVTVSSVKVYRVTHLIVRPDLFAKGTEPNDPTQYMPYFQGEFDAQGNMLANDYGFLYTPLPARWLHPWERSLLPPSYPLNEDNVREATLPDGNPETQYLLDRLKIHAEYIRRNEQAK